jgi:hypothetical protein
LGHSSRMPGLREVVPRDLSHIVLVRLGHLQQVLA